jgi:hypothetical protein
MTPAARPRVSSQNTTCGRATYRAIPTPQIMRGRPMAARNRRKNIAMLQSWRMNQKKKTRK